MSRCFRSIVPFILCAMFAPAVAQDVYVPPELQPWRQWVLHQKEYRACPFLFNAAAVEATDFVCAWPGVLSLAADRTGATFSQSWTVYAAEQWITLPGDGKNWPEAVQANQRPASVVLRDGVPMLRLGPGQHSVNGQLAWDERPQTLAIPRQSGLLALTVDGRRIARPDRDAASVWLGDRQQQTAEQNAVQVQVYRQLADDVPTRLTTWLILDVAGSVREETFGPVLPEDWIPLAIESDLPARLEPDGGIRLQLRPGRWNLRLIARAQDVLNTVAMPRPQGNLPESEIWSYQSNDRLRVTAVEGANPVDPSQVNVPGEWRELPAFRLQAGDALVLNERSRGKVADDNRLQLERQLWLDFNGDGFVYADRIGGEMRSEWRLNMAAPYSLLNATEAEDNLLITRRDDGPAGIEVRQSDVAIEALGRIETRGRFPAAGWESRFDSMSVALNLPPGHRLIAAPGVDAARGSWVSQWQLLDFFLLLIVTIATARLFGNAAGVVALVALILGLHEVNSAGWSWLNLLAAVALVRVAPAGRLALAARAYRALSTVIVLAIVVPFLVGQLRYAIHPQLENQAGTYDYGYLGAADPNMREAYPASSPVDAMSLAQPERKVTREMSRLEEIVVTGGRTQKSYSRYADNAVVQAGPGRPAWRWNQYKLEFSGPVDVDRTVRLVVLPDGLLSILRFLLVLATGAFASIFVFEIVGRLPHWKLPVRIHIGSAVASTLIVFAFMMTHAAELRAETPSPQILKELEQRLLQPPECAPRCAEAVAAEVRISTDTLSIDMTVHALATVAVPLPGSMGGWRAERIAVNGSASPVYRGNDGELWVQVRAGQSNIALQGPLPPVASLEVPFPAPPRAITTRGEGWFVAGIRDRRLVSGSLQLTRLQKQGEDDSSTAWELSRLPVFVRIERQLELDLDWRVNTTVYRIAPQQGALTIDVPLLEGESIVSGDFKVSGNAVQVSMNPGAYSVSWSSALPRSSPLILSASKGKPWSEVWRLAIGSVWHAEFEGLPESESGQHIAEVRMAEFYPRAGESLTVHADRPEGVAGNTLAFDTVGLETTLGARSQDSTLSLDYRSTRGTQHVLKLPQNAEVVSVVIDGRVEPLRANEGALNIPILPGKHSVKVDWRTASDLSFRSQTPSVDLGAAAGNITLGMELPDNRWILFTRGPDLGPAVLYWSELAALILLALILGRLKLTPLRATQWVLLGLGFSTFSWAAFAVVAVWLLGSDLRNVWPGGKTWWQFNLMQIAFALLSVAAVIAIITSLPAGLLGTPDMHVDGYRSFNGSLNWFADRSESELPRASVVTAPLWLYKTLILAWALWLSFALLKWLPWVWQAFVKHGLWRSRRVMPGPSPDGGAA